MEPVTTITTAWGLAKAAGEIGKKLYELGKEVKDREVKQQIDEILDKVRDMKQSASNLEDENRELREKLRFKTDDYQFEHPFWYHKGNPERALCPKCFAQNVAAPMGEKGQGISKLYRKCLVCNHPVQVEEHKPQPPRRLSRGFQWG